MQPPEAPAPATIVRRAHAPDPPVPGSPAAAPPGPPPSAPPAAPPGPNLFIGRVLVLAVALALVGVSAYLLVDRDFSTSLVNVTGQLARLAFILALLALAAWPQEAARRLRTPFLATPRGLAAAVLVGAAAYVVFGLGTLVETASLLQQAQQGAPPEDLVPVIQREDLLVSLTFNFLLFTIPALAWAAWAEGHRGEAALAWLGLHAKGWRWSVAWSLLAVLVVFWFLVLAGLATRVGGAGEVDNPRAEAIARALDVPSALLVAALTGIGEEVFFRGLLQRKVGNVPQAILFGLAHLNYLQVLEVVVTAILGYGFGRTVQKTGNLWGPIIGHATFNAVSLLLILSKQNGWLG